MLRAGGGLTVDKRTTKCAAGKFVEFEGEVHLIAGAGGGEHTLCGCAFDAADSEHDESLRFRPTKRRIITCHGCSVVVLACRGVRTAGTEP